MALQAARETEGTLADVIDRVLDRGVVLQGDLIITLSGIPLLGANLRLALAGMETMLAHGLMRDWDEAQRALSRSRHQPGADPNDESGASTGSRRVPTGTASPRS